VPEYSCAEGSYNKSDWSNLGNHSALNATETADVCDLSCNIEFDNSTMQNTIGTVWPEESRLHNLLNSVTEYNLICDSSWLNSFLTSITFIGFLSGAAVGGYLRSVLTIAIFWEKWPKMSGEIIGQKVFNASKWQFRTKIYIYIIVVFGLCSNSCSTLYSVDLLLCRHANIPSWPYDRCICKYSIICNWNSWKRLQTNGCLHDLWYSIIDWVYCNGF